MKKLLTAILVGTTIFATGTSALAKLSYEDFVKISMEKNSLADNEEALKNVPKDKDGNYIVYTDGTYTTDVPIDIQKTFQLYRIRTDKRPDVENYDGSGLKNYFKEYRADSKYDYRFGAQQEEGKEDYLTVFWDEVCASFGMEITDLKEEATDAIDVLNASGEYEVYDAYDISFGINVYFDTNKGELSIRGTRYSGICFDTDKGEFIVLYYVSRQKFEPVMPEALKLYTVDEFLEYLVAPYDGAGTVEHELVTTDENGDDVFETIVETPRNDNDEELNDEDKKPDEEEEEEPEVIVPEEEEEEPEDKKQEEIKDEEDEKEEKPEILPAPNGEIRVDLKGKFLEFIDQKPIIENDRVLVPFRVIFEALEADVKWDGETKTVTATKGDITITLTIGENKITKNGKAIEVDVPAQIKNERTMVPIRVVSEAFENNVNWDKDNRIVGIK